jgi:hypothetical protein
VTKWMMTVLIFSPVSALAGTVLQTMVHCTVQSSVENAAQNPGVFTQTVQSNQVNSVALAEYSLWPLKNGENKSLLISKNGVQGTYAHLNLGEGASTSVFIALPQANGDVQKCIVLMTKEDGEERYIFEY